MKRKLYLVKLGVCLSAIAATLADRHRPHNQHHNPSRAAAE